MGGRSHVLRTSSSAWSPNVVIARVQRLMRGAIYHFRAFHVSRLLVCCAITFLLEQTFAQCKVFWEGTLVFYGQSCSRCWRCHFWKLQDQQLATTIIKKSLKTPCRANISLSLLHRTLQNLMKWTPTKRFRRLFEWERKKFHEDAHSWTNAQIVCT